MCQDKHCVKTVGIILTAICFGLGVAALVLSSIEFKTVYATWSDSPYINLGPTQVTAAVLMIVSSIFGFIVFSPIKHKLDFDFFYCVFLVISVLFCYAIGIFAAVGAAMKGRVDKVVGCETENTGLKSIWKNMDEYFILANSMFCSDLCPCTLTQSTMNAFENSRFASDTFVNSKYYSGSGGASSIRDCNEKAVADIMRLYVSNPNNTMRHLDHEKFIKYWEKIEKKFDCTGWCKTNYKNVFTLQNEKMYKYVFSDVNRGVPKYPGCLNRILKWIHTYTSIIASFLLFSAFLGTFNLILACTFIGIRKIEKQRKMKNFESHE